MTGSSSTSLPKPITFLLYGRPHHHQRPLKLGQGSGRPYMSLWIIAGMECPSQSSPFAESCGTYYSQFSLHSDSLISRNRLYVCVCRKRDWLKCDRWLETLILASIRWQLNEIMCNLWSVQYTCTLPRVIQFGKFQKTICLGFLWQQRRRIQKTTIIGCMFSQITGNYTNFIQLFF